MNKPPDNSLYERRVAAVRAFVTEHGHSRIPRDVTVDGIKLGTWAANQRADHRRGQLAVERTRLLDAVPGWVWAPNTLPTFTCAYCGTEFVARVGDRAGQEVFCKKEHYHEWQRQGATYDNGEGRRRDYARYKREVWGGSGRGRNDIMGNWAKTFGASFEERARDVILPAEGFTDVDHVASRFGTFVVDFICTAADGDRVLLDVTSKYSGHVPEKRKLADSLRMRLYLLHISPADMAVYYLHEPAGRTSKVPMAVFHRLHARRAEPIPGWPREATVPAIPA